MTHIQKAQLNLKMCWEAIILLLTPLLEKVEMMTTTLNENFR